MKNPLRFIVYITAATIISLHGQELLPELAPGAKQHRESSAAIAAQKAVAITAAQQAYLTALETVDKAATAAGNIQIVNAVAKEREAVAKGGMTDGLPSGLPKTLNGPRKIHINAIERVVIDFSKRQSAVDGAYLRAIAGVQPKAAKNPTLAAQILSEKQRLLNGIHGPISDLRIGLAGSRWRRIGSKDNHWNFMRNGKLNDTWKYEALSADKLRITWSAPDNGITVSLGKDGKTLLEGGKPTWELILE